MVRNRLEKFCRSKRVFTPQYLQPKAGYGTQKRRYHPKKWAGVYVYETSEIFNGSPDLCFYITFKSGRRLIWEKVGKISEGYGPDAAADILSGRRQVLRLF